MCDPVSLTIAAAVVSAGGQIYGGMAANAQGKYEQKVANANARMEYQAREDARQRGDTAQLQHYRALSQRMGLQRAQLAASGLDISFGSAADLQGDTLMLGLEDSRTLGENTSREMRGFEINAANYTMQGRAARARGKQALIGSYFGAASSLLGGASQVASHNASTKVGG